MESWLFVCPHYSRIRIISSSSQALITIVLLCSSDSIRFVVLIIIIPLISHYYFLIVLFCFYSYRRSYFCNRKRRGLRWYVSRCMQMKFRTGSDVVPSTTSLAVGVWDFRAGTDVLPVAKFHSRQRERVALASHKHAGLMITVKFELQRSSIAENPSVTRPTFSSSEIDTMRTALERLQIEFFAYRHDPVFYQFILELEPRLWRYCSCLRYRNGISRSRSSKTRRRAVRVNRVLCISSACRWLLISSENRARETRGAYYWRITEQIPVTLAARQPCADRRWRIAAKCSVTDSDDDHSISGT